jgi:tRNA-splicing ligase RtcB
MKHVINTPGSVPIKIWADDIEDKALEQLKRLAKLPFILPNGVASMADAHMGTGSAIGTVLATQGAIIPAAVGLDIGCGMMAQELSISAKELPDSLRDLRLDLERAVPVGFETVKGRYVKGNWSITPNSIVSRWRSGLYDRYMKILEKHPKVDHKNVSQQLGSLGGGNHFIELCVDSDTQRLWVMLHSGSRGVGNLIGRYFIELAKEDMRVHHINLPDKDLSYLSEGTQWFNDYIEAMLWAQDYAMENRQAMMEIVLRTVRQHLPTFQLGKTAVSCHHNFAEREHHFGQNVWVTRKGAVRARVGDLGIIPGSMGTKSYIVRGLGNEHSYHSCSHGAGRAMSRTAAEAKFSHRDLEDQTLGVECRKDKNIVAETPLAYKDIDVVMANQQDLVEVLHTIKQVLVVKGG